MKNFLSGAATLACDGGNISVEDDNGEDEDDNWDDEDDDGGWVEMVPLEGKFVVEIDFLWEKEKKEGRNINTNTITYIDIIST